MAPAVATILAQIACNENALPQGSPCSPIISNLIAHVLDVRLAQLAKRTGCRYSRYADDLTFSTNDQNFPTKIARQARGSDHQWQVGNELERVIVKSGFKVNPSKTRMQLEVSRQDVTGLIVNKKVNTRAEYRHIVRAMTHRLLATGKFYRKETAIDASGKLIETEVEGSLNQLNGMHSFIDSIGVHNTKKLLAGKTKKGEKVPELGSKKALGIAPPDSKDQLFGSFLFYRHFYALDKPLIVFEGETDIVYIRAAIRSLADDFPELIKKQKDGTVEYKVGMYRFSKTTSRLLGLGGGTGDLVNFIRAYKVWRAKIGAPGMKYPVILFVDNDDGVRGSGGIFSAIKTETKSGALLPENWIVLS